MASQNFDETLTKRQQDDLVNLELNHLKRILKINLKIDCHEDDVEFKDGVMKELDHSLYYPYASLSSNLRMDYFNSHVNTFLPCDSDSIEKIKSILITHSATNSIWHNLEPKSINTNKLVASNIDSKSYESETFFKQYGNVLHIKLLHFSAELCYIHSSNIRQRIISSIVTFLKEFELRTKSLMLSNDFDKSQITISDELCLLMYAFKTVDQKIDAADTNKARTYLYYGVFKETLIQIKEFMDELSLLIIQPNQAAVIPESPKQSSKALFKFLSWEKSILLKCYLREYSESEDHGEAFEFDNNWYSVFTGSTEVHIAWHAPSTHLVSFLMDIHAATKYLVKNANVNPLINPQFKEPQWKKMNFIKFVLDDEENSLLDVQFIKRRSISGKDYKSFQLLKIESETESVLKLKDAAEMTPTHQLLIKILGVEV